jgi:hypothetical protein
MAGKHQDCCNEDSLILSHIPIEFSAPSGRLERPVFSATCNMLPWSLMLDFVGMYVDGVKKEAAIEIT